MSAATTITAATATSASMPRSASVASPRLLLFTRDDPTQVVGGVETFALQLLALFPGSETIAYGGAAGRRLLLDEARDARAARATVLARLAARPVDLVVANGAAAWALGHLPVPRITVLHGTYAGFGRAIAPVAGWRGAVARHYGGFLERRATRGAAAVVAVSSSVAEQARALYGVRDRLVVIEHGLAFDAAAAAADAASRRANARAELDLAANAPLLLFVGRGDATKGFDLLVELARRHPEWRFAAAGVDPVGDRARDRATTLPANVTALGTLAPAPLARWRAAADAIVLPTCYEGCSYALLEALAADRPIVTTATGAFPDPGLHAFGIVVPARTARRDERCLTALAAAITTVLARPQQFAPRTVADARFTAARFEQQWRALVAEVLHRER